MIGVPAAGGHADEDGGDGDDTETESPQQAEPQSPSTPARRGRPRPRQPDQHATEEVRFHIIRNARIENVGKSQSCMVSKLRIIWKGCAAKTNCGAAWSVGETTTRWDRGTAHDLAFITQPCTCAHLFLTENALCRWDRGTAHDLRRVDTHSRPAGRAVPRHAARAPPSDGASV